MIGAIQAHPSLYKLLSCAHGKAEEKLEIEARKLPMIVPPQLWSSSTEGGYLVASCKKIIMLILILCCSFKLASLVRCYSDTYQHQLSLESTDLTPVLDALNYLGGCAWKINTKV